MFTENMVMTRFEDRCRLIFGAETAAGNQDFWTILKPFVRYTQAHLSTKKVAYIPQLAPWIAIQDFTYWSHLWHHLGKSEPRYTALVLSCLCQTTFDASTSVDMMAHVAASLSCLGMKCPWLLGAPHAHAFCTAIDRCARPRGLRLARSSSWGDMQLASQCCELIFLQRKQTHFPAWSEAFAARLHPTLVLVHPRLGSLIEQLCLADVSAGGESSSVRRL